MSDVRISYRSLRTLVTIAEGELERGGYAPTFKKRLEGVIKESWSQLSKFKQKCADESEEDD